jgi:hypothetical protein
MIHIMHRLRNLPNQVRTVLGERKDISGRAKWVMTNGEPVTF